jgi:hypothetical protein
LVEDLHRPIRGRPYVERQVVPAQRAVLQAGGPADVGVPAFERAVRPVDLKHVVPAVGVEGLDEHVAWFERDEGQRAGRQRPACAQGDARAVVCDQLAFVADAPLAAMVTFVDAHE